MGVYHSGAHKNRQVYPCAFGGTYRKKYFNWCIVVVLKLCCTLEIPWGASTYLMIMPWLGGSVGWGMILYTKRMWIQFLVREHIQVVGSIPSWGMYGKQVINVSLSPFLCKINKYILR